MNISASKSDLSRAVALAAAVADRKSTIPIVGNILLVADADGLTVSATDLTISVQSRCAAKVSAPGGTTLPAKLLHDVVRSVAGDSIDLKFLDGARVQIASGKSRHAIAALPADQFPKLQVPPDAWSTMPAEALADIIAKTLHSCSNDETRYHLNGVLLESADGILRGVSTDGHRLSKVERKCDGLALPASLLVPRKALAEIAKLLGDKTVEVAATSAYVFVRAGGVTLSAKLIEAQFPPYAQVIPAKTKRTAIVDRARLLDGIRRVSILAPESTAGVQVSLAAGSLTLKSENPETGEAVEEIETDYSGDDVSIGFNARYLEEALSRVGCADVEVRMSGELDPCIIRGTSQAEGADFLSVVMPMRNR